MRESTYVRRQDDGRRREVQLGDIERLIQKIGGVELVERTGPRLGRKLLRLLLGSGPEVHGRHAGGEPGDASRSRGSSGRGVVRLRGLVTSDWSWGWLGHPIRLLRLGAVGSGLGFWLRIPSICRHGSPELACPLHLTTDGGVAPYAHIEGARSICSLLFLAMVRVMRARSRRRGGGRVRITLVGVRGLSLLGGLLGRILAVAVVGSGHGEVGGAQQRVRVETMCRLRSVDTSRWPKGCLWCYFVRGSECATLQMESWQ
jgi:hypothetical protein